MKFFISIVLFLSYSSKSNTEPLQNKVGSEREWVDEQQKIEVNQSMLDVTVAQVGTLNEEQKKAILITRIFNELSNNPEASKSAISLYNGNYKDFDRRIKNQQSKKESDSSVSVTVPIGPVFFSLGTTPEQLVKIIQDSPLNVENQLVGFLNQPTSFNNIFEINKQKLDIAKDVAEVIDFCNRDSSTIETCKLDEGRRRLIQTFFPNLSPDNVIYTDEAQLFLNTTHQKKISEGLGAILDGVTENKDNISNIVEGLEELHDKLIKEQPLTPYLDYLVSQRSDDPYIAKLNEESDRLFTEMKVLAEKNEFIKSALELEDKEVSKILGSLKQEINTSESEKEKQDLEKAYKGFAEIDKLKKQKDIYKLTKTVNNVQAYYTAGLTTINVLNELGVLPEDFPIKEIKAFGVVVIQTFEIGKQISAMAIAGSLDPTGITVIMTAVSIIASAIINTGPTFEEAVMEVLGQLLEGQRKIVENQQQIMKGIKHLDRRLDGIDKKLDIIVDMLGLIHEENRYSHEEIISNINRLREDFQKDNALEKEIRKENYIKDAMTAYNALSYYKGEGFSNESVVREPSSDDDPEQQIKHNLISSDLSNSKYFLNEMNTFSTIELPGSRITEEFNSSVDFTWVKNESSQMSEIKWQGYMGSLYNALSKGLLEKLNFLYSENSDLLIWLNEELRKRDITAVKEPNKIGQPFYQDEIFSASVLLASAMSSYPNLIGHYDKDDKVAEICLESKKIEQASKKMRAELPKAWEVYQDYTKKLLSFHSKKNPGLRLSMEEVAADHILQEDTVSFEKGEFIFRLPVKPEKQKEFLKENPFSKALFDRKYDHSDNYCDDRYYNLPNLEDFKKECVQASSLREELIHTLTQFQIGNKLYRPELIIDSNDIYEQRLDYDLEEGIFYSLNYNRSDRDHSYSELYSAPVLILTGTDWNNQRYEKKISFNRNWDHIIMALGYWNYDIRTYWECMVATVRNTRRCQRDPDKMFSLECQVQPADLVIGIGQEDIHDCFAPIKEKIFVPDRRAFLKDLKTQLKDLSYKHLFESELMANWLKAKLVFETMTYMAYGDSLLSSSKLSDLRRLFYIRVANSADGISHEEVFSFFEDLKKVYSSDSNEDSSLQSFVPLESYWEFFPVGLGYPEVRSYAMELASQESLQLGVCNSR